MAGKEKIIIPDSENPRVVIIGGGFAGIELAKALKNKNYQVVLFDRHNYHTFQPLLYQVATAGLEPDSIAGPLRRLIHYKKDFYFRMAEVESIDSETNCIHTSIGSLVYDYLAIASGSRTNYFGNSEIKENSFPLKEIIHALDLRSHILQNFEKAVLTSDVQEKQSLMNYVVVGGGPTGVEVSGALGELKLHVLPNDYPDLDFRKMEIYLIEGNTRLLSGMSEYAGNKAFKYLKKFDVVVHIEKIVESYDGEMALLNDGSQIPTNTLIWAAGVKANGIKGLESKTNMEGRLEVDDENRVLGCSNIFAIGDMAAIKSQEYPKGHPMLASVAGQQGRFLGRNLGRLSRKKPMKPFRYNDKGTLATIGRNRAVADFKGNLKLGGRIAWFIWMFVHLFLLIGFRNRLVVFSNWVWNYFTYDRGTRLIIRPFVRKNSKKAT